MAAVSLCLNPSKSLYPSDETLEQLLRIATCPYELSAYMRCKEARADANSPPVTARQEPDKQQRAEHLGLMPMPPSIWRRMPLSQSLCCQYGAYKWTGALSQSHSARRQVSQSTQQSNGLGQREGRNRSADQVRPEAGSAQGTSKGSLADSIQVPDVARRPLTPGSASRASGKHSTWPQAGLFSGSDLPLLGAETSVVRGHHHRAEMYATYAAAPETPEDR
ncbi:hypothetical protein M441DRAFT_447490 [Trichoderma asperellum CBS 433.97]|uniref:Uncharacterized protein n=1 Tax=Trichoderma asperellum (strain ATCC 204424 / CBS 433.97 / NBRC 101777) TaxID=1042311 RepID=A0A2T3YYA0_TRIA4|nr:hypothetical protein M441DRAFT_447490 [Trichoderma asperellum CBS 433.97]PTB37504.1 hypothetical protein M441DRAFT_447490 [Trichoderma asperellum CBS 433.97]